MDSLLEALAPYAKALVLLAVVITAAALQLAGVDVGLDARHYAALLAADVAVWAVPNKADR